MIWFRTRIKGNTGFDSWYSKKLSLSQSVQNGLPGSYQNGTAAYFSKGRPTLLLTCPVTSVHNAFLIQPSSAQYMQRDAPADASFACDWPAFIGAARKEWTRSTLVPESENLHPTALCRYASQSGT